MGLIGYIYTSERGLDPLSVLPRNAKRVCITNANGPFDPSDDLPPVKIIAGNLPGTLRCVPVNVPSGKWLSFGGSYVACADSRFRELCEQLLDAPFYGAIALHDRCES